MQLKALTRPVLHMFHDCGIELLLAPKNVRDIKETVKYLTWKIY
jgi:hypothetical protein